MSATGGPAVDITGTTRERGGFSFDDVDSTSSAGDGINLAGLGTGGFSANANSTIGGAAGISFDLDGGSGTVTFPGTFNNGSGQTAEITGRSGGSVSFSGPVNDTNDAGGGIMVSNNTGGSTTFSNATKTINTSRGRCARLQRWRWPHAHAHGRQSRHRHHDRQGHPRQGLALSARATAEHHGRDQHDRQHLGRALDVTNTDVGGTPLTFQRISSNGAASRHPAQHHGPDAALTVAGERRNLHERQHRAAAPAA